jgi:hypothetical protein
MFKLFLCTAQVKAEQIDYPLGAFNPNASLLLRTPRPMLYLIKAKSKLKVVPFFYKRSTTRITYDEAFAETGIARTKGLSVGLTKSYKEKWGVWGLLLGGKTEGSATLSLNNCVSAINGICLNADFPQFSWTNINLGFGLTYEVFNLKKYAITLPIYFGPFISYANLKQSMASRDNSGLVSDFDIHSEGTMGGLMFGWQAGIPLASIPGVNKIKFLHNFTWEPFMVGYKLFINQCQKYQVTSVRTADTSGHNLQTLSSPGCREKASRLDYGSGRLKLVPRYRFIEGVNGVGGMGFTYNPWNITFDVITRGFLSHSGNKGIHNEVAYSISFGFGNSKNLLPVKN